MANYTGFLGQGRKTNWDWTQSRNHYMCLCFCWWWMGFILDITFTGCKTLRTRLLTLLACQTPSLCLLEIKLGRAQVAKRGETHSRGTTFLSGQVGWIWSPLLSTWLPVQREEEGVLLVLELVKGADYGKGWSLAQTKHIHGKLSLDILSLNMHSYNKCQWITNVWGFYCGGTMEHKGSFRAVSVVENVIQGESKPNASKRERKQGKINGKECQMTHVL